MVSSKNLSISRELDGISADPELSQWPTLVQTNQMAHGRTAASSAFRAELLERAMEYTSQTLGDTRSPLLSAAPVVATGHQPVWHHCGIWMKTVACSRLAQAVRGTPVQVVLDHDVCDTAIVIPQARPDGSWHCRSLSIEQERRDDPLERRRPHAECIEQFLHRVVEGDPEQFCNGPWATSDNTSEVRWDRLRTIADVITYLQVILSRALGLDNLLSLPVSQLSTTNVFLGFVTSVFSDAMCFSRYYNDALAEQAHSPPSLRRCSIQSLAIDGRRGQTELPFWLTGPEGDRTTLRIRQETGGATAIMGDSSEVTRLGPGSTEHRARQLKEFLARARWLLRPKAVPLTLFLRLYLADWFIHGVGGATYEAITDHLIRNYFGIKPAPYGVVTYTAALPRCLGPAQPEPDLSQLRHRLHHAEHNPESYLGGAGHENDQVRLLIEAKRRQIIQANDRTRTTSQRKAAWKLITRINRCLREHAAQEIRDLRQEILQAEKERNSRAVRGSREYFFGLFPEWRLRQIMDAVAFSQSATAAERAPTCGEAC